MDFSNNKQSLLWMGFFGLRPQNDNFFVLFFYCHPEGSPNRRVGKDPMAFSNKKTIVLAAKAFGLRRHIRHHTHLSSLKTS